MITLVMAVCLLGECPNTPILVDRVHVVEINHFYDENGKLVFDQLMFFNWSDEDGRFNLVAWRLLKKQHQWPIYDWHHKKYISMWRDGDTIRRVFAGYRYETWTQYDPELYERTILPKEKRLELSTVDCPERKKP